MSFTAKIMRNIRSTERYAVEIDGTLRDAEWRPFDVTVIDLSIDGFRVPAVVDLPIGCSISLGLAGIGPREAIVMRSSNVEYGCQFIDRLTDEEIVAATEVVSSEPVLFTPGVTTPNAQIMTQRITRYSPRLTLAVFGAASVASWAAIVAARFALG